MISIKYPWNNVGIGNHLFIYAYLRLLAEKLNYKLSPTPVVINEHNRDRPSTYVFSNIEGNDYSFQEEYHIDDGFAVRYKTLDNVIDFFQNKKAHIISNGYYQKYSYWGNHANIIKSYYCDLINNNKLRDNLDVAIHLRSSNKDCRYKLSPTYYLQALDTINFKRLFVFADDYKRHTDTMEVLSKYDPIECNLPYIDTIKEISSFQTIILSQGSSSFWMGFLSQAKHVIVPVTDFPLISIPHNECISPTHIDKSIADIDYYIKDERYTYIDLRSNS